MLKLNSSEAVVKSLQELGITHVFGMPGFQHLPFYNAIALQNMIRHILIRDERSGAFMADSFARV